MTGFTNLITGTSSELSDDANLRAGEQDRFSPTTGQVTDAYIKSFLTEDGESAKFSDYVEFKKLQGSEAPPPPSGADAWEEQNGYKKPSVGLSRVLSADEFKDSDYEKAGVDYFDGIREESANFLKDRKNEQRRRDFVLSRGSTPQNVLGFVAGLASAFVDPVNVASAFVPIPGLTTARIAKVFQKIGKVKGRAAVGAAQGAFGSVITEPFYAGASSALQDDYGMTDSLLNITFGTFLSSGMHLGLGGVSDISKARKLRGIRQDRAARVSVEDHIDATNLAIAQISEGHAVNVEPVIRAGAEKNRLTSVQKGEVDPFDPRVLFSEDASPVRSNEFSIGKASGKGQSAKFDNYTPIGKQDQRWLEGLNAELQGTNRGTLTFVDDLNGPRQTVIGVKGDTPEWFTQINKDVTASNKARAKALKSKDPAKRKSAPDSQATLTRDKVNKVVGKLLDNKPLGKQEADIAQTVTTLAREMREENVSQMLSERFSRQDQAKVASERKASIEKSASDLADQMNRGETLTALDPRASKDADELLANSPERTDATVKQEIEDLEADLANFDLTKEEADELLNFKQLEIEADHFANAFRASGLCIRSNS